MRKQLLIVVAIFMAVTTMAQNKRACASNEVLVRQNANPKTKELRARIEQHTQSFIARGGNANKRTGILTIPVIVHVIYNTAQENISDAQIQSQIDVLTEDYRKLNADVSLAPSEFASSAADIQIEFTLAQITRKQSSKTSWGTNDAMKSSSQGGVDVVSPDSYLNIWVCNIGGGILGYAQFPGGAAATDGVVISPNYFGSSDLQPAGETFYLSSPFDKGRTATHEVGHYLNLRHIWGDGNCSADDYVSDTPIAGAANYGCPSYPSKSCNNNGGFTSDMFMNYMDYVDDACMYMFTAGQKARMDALFEAGGARENLGSSSGGCSLAAPGSLSSSAIGDNQFTVSWNSVSGASSYDVSLDGTVSNTSSTNKTFTGLTAGTTYTVKVRSVCSDGTSGAYSSGYQVTTTGSNCNVGPVTLSITMDNYPSETSWTLVKDGSTVASGSGYKTKGQTITQSFNYGTGSYTFTINDAYGDGICCSYGNGSYSLTDDNGAVIVSGGNFTSSESTSYCVGAGAPDTQAPSAPSSLSSSSVTTSSVALSWSGSTDNVGVTGYKVYRGSANISTVTGTSTTVTGLSSGTSYSFHVTAVDAAANESASSNTVNVTTLTPDTQAPSVPTGLSSSNVTQTSLTLSWSASSDNVGVTGYDVYQGASLIKSVTGTSTSISGLSANTTYSFKVRAKDAAGNTSAQSSGLSVTTLAQAVTYCTTGGNNTNYEWIDLVQIGSINNVTGTNGGYADFTSISTALAQGSSYTINFSAGFSSSSYTERWRVWIDFNQDGDFADSGEQVVSGSTSNASSYSATVSVPSGASLGSTRMRVSMEYGSVPSSCGSFTYGEVEDYTVNIVSAGSAKTASNDLAPGQQLGKEITGALFNLYPNPANDVLNFSTGEFKDVSSVRVIDLGGREMMHSSNMSNRTLDVSALKPGLYFFEMETEKGKFQSKFIKK